MSKLRMIFVVVVGLIGCQKNAAQDAGADAAFDESAVRSHYAALEREAPKVDVSTFARGDVALAKGRSIATVLRAVNVAWAKEEAQLGDQSAEAKHLLHRLTSPQAPYCPNNDLKNCGGHPWFAEDPSKAGVIVYVERRSDKDGTYGQGGANSYATSLRFDAVLVPEKLRVAHWNRIALPPQSQVRVGGGSTMMQMGQQAPESFQADMQKLASGAAPASDFAEDQ
jgi:hypothetical protein